MIANVLLVKYDGGYVEVAHDDILWGVRRKEQLFDLGGVTEEADAVAIARAMLVVKHEPTTTIVVAALPLGEGSTETDVAFREGDRVSIPGFLPHVVKGVSYSENDDGTLEVVPELAANMELEEARINRIIARYAEGNLNGSKNARPSGTFNPNATGAQVSELPPFSFNGTLDQIVGLKSPAYTPGRPIVLTEAHVTLSVAGTTASVIQMFVNDMAGPAFTIPAGSRSIDFDASSGSFTTMLLGTDSVQMGVTSAGTDAAGITVQIRAVVA